ncbi:FAD-dependent oxidoreductase [Undibacterium sp. Di26W]|uniref:FAD-dependent oxidoreductase n=1 Tax=Undibacterium sp. Di26W TaxID=3413035 RepID=UPI003BF25C30
MSIENPSRFRVAIIGGGPAGSACALALAQRGVSNVVLIEAHDYSQFCIGESIPPESLRLFQALEIDQAFLLEGHAPCYGSCSYWGSDKRGYNDTLMNPFGHGWHLDRRKFNRFLAGQAQSRGVELRVNTMLKDVISSVASGYELHLAEKTSTTPDQTRIHADFVIDASGPRAVFARKCGSQKRNAHALVCLARRFAITDTQVEKNGLTHLEAVRHGWWYGANLPDATLLLAFYSDANTVKAQQLQQIQAWDALMAAAPHTQKLAQAGIPMSDGILSFPAPVYCLDQLHGANWLAIGDAASAYDPLTSQGICKAIANAIAAADAIVNKGEIRDVAQSIRMQYQQFSVLCKQYYRQEQRWPDSPFWEKYHIAHELISSAS